MPEMNRVTAGHGSTTSPFNSGTPKPKGRLSSLLEGIAAGNQGGQQSLESQRAQHEHEINTMITKHVLAKDMHTHISKGAGAETPITMDYEGIKTGIIKRAPKTRGAAAVTPEEHVETPASTPHAAEAESAPRAEHHTVNIGSTIPTNPGEWQGGWMEHNPETGRAQTKPGYKEFKTRKQHFEAGVAAQTAAQAGQHFTPKSGIKIPNYARKAMTKRGKA